MLCTVFLKAKSSWTIVPTELLFYATGVLSCIGITYLNKNIIFGVFVSGHVNTGHMGGGLDFPMSSGLKDSLNLALVLLLIVNTMELPWELLWDQKTSQGSFNARVCFNLLGCKENLIGY